MRRETIAVHGGYDCDPTTKAVAVPIYQTVAYEFDSADHAAALFDLEAEGFATPASAIRPTPCWRSASPSSRAASARSASPPDRRRSTTPSPMSPITAATSSPRRQLYGATHTLFAHVLARAGRRACASPSESPDDMARADRRHTRAVFCESVGNPAGNICDIEALAEAAHAHGVAAHRRQHGGDPRAAAPDRTSAPTSSFTR